LIFVSPEEVHVNQIEEQFSESVADTLTEARTELDKEIADDDALN